MPESEFTLEKLEISKRLGRIEIQLAQFNENFRGHTEQDMIMQKQMMRLIENHDNALHGVNGQPGMRLELDRIKEREKNRAKGFWAVTIAVIGLVVKTFVGLFTFKP